MEENNKKPKNSLDSQKPNNGSGSMPPLDLKLKNSNQNSAPEELIIKTESDNNSQKAEPKEANSNPNNNNSIPNINTGGAQNNNTNNYQTGMPPQPNNNFNNGNLPPAPSKNHTGLIIGIIVGVLVLFIFIAGMIILAVTLSKNKTKVVTNNGSSNSSTMDSSDKEDTSYSSSDAKLDTSAPDYNKDYYYSFRTDGSYYGPDWEVQGSTSDPGTRSFSNPTTGCVATFKSTANDPKKSSYQAIEDSINEIKTFKEFSDVVIVDRDSNSVIIPKLGSGNIYLKSYQINFKQNGLPARARISAYATSKSILFATETCLDQNWSKGQLEFYDIEDKQQVLGY